jgi:hypothetical protein
MKLYKILFAIAIPLLAVGCANDANEIVSDADSANNIDTTKGLVQTYVENNTYIDVDVPSISYSLVNPSTRSVSVNEDDIAKMKTAIYRFYKNVSVKDGYYVCSIQNGADINISESVFMALYENLNQMNAFIKEAKEKGEVVNVTEPNEKYLNSLLK